MPEVLVASTTFKKTIGNSELSVIHFAADWADQCQQVDDLLDTLSKHKDYKNIKFYKCLAESLPEISLDYKIEAVPVVIIYRSGKLIERIDGADAARITEKIQMLITQSGDVPQQQQQEPLEERLKKLINKAPVMLFMKGDRNTPRCGFSRQIVQILNDTGASYETFDILTDEEVRQGLKTFSNWPTYPQLYVKGELIGGLDIVKEMLATDELATILKTT